MSIPLFSSSGPDPFAHLKAHLSEVPRAPFSGMWATIELRPDSFARQRYTVGVVVADHQGGFTFRLLDDLSKFECLYGRDDVATVRSLLESAEHSLLRARKTRTPVDRVQFESDALCVGDLWPTSGQSAEAIASRLYADAIPLLPRDERKAREFVTLDNASVRMRVDEELKRVAGLAFERITTEPQRILMDSTTGEPHRLEFNLEPPGKAGSVISAVYKTPDRVELNFLRASRDLATYARMKRLQERLALFVMTPSQDSMASADIDRIENVLGEQSWSLEKQGFLVSAHDSAEPLARDVWEWAAIG